MVMALNTELRKLLNAFADGSFRLPVHVGNGNFYFVPSGTVLGEFHIVCQIQYAASGQILRGWACSCRAFRFDRSGEDRCKHIDDVEQGLVGAGGATTPWTGGQSSKSPTASKSGRATDAPRSAASPKRSKGTSKASTGSSSKTKARAAK